MNKRMVIVTALSLFAMLIVPGVFRAGLFGTTEESGKSDAATIQEARGECSYKPKDASAWKDVTVESTYTTDTALKTGGRSYMQVAFDDLNSFRMKSNTQVVVGGIEEKSKDKESGVIKVIQLDIIDGEIGVKLKKLPKDHMLKVSGPTAIAGASGTGFSVFADRAGAVTKLAVYESKVLLEALDMPNKAVEVSEFQEARAESWKSAVITGTGTGYLSVAVLGQDFIDNLKEPADEIVIEATGTGKTPEGLDDDAAMAEAKKLALEDAYSNMARIILPMSIDDKQTVADLIKADHEVAKRAYEVIAKSEVTEESFEEGTASATVRINLEDLSDAIGKDLQKILASVREISRQDYIDKFGARALISTETAAKVVAQRDITEKLYGSVIMLGTTLGDKAADDNTITIKVRGIVQGAKTVSRKYFADGSIQVGLEAPGEEAQSELGRALVGDTWLSSPTAVVVDDYGMMETLAGGN